jgi:predicted DNA-binding protein
MTKRKAAASPERLHQLTVRIAPGLNARLEAVSVVTGRTYRNLAETAIEEYLSRLKLTPDQQRKLKALLD